MSNPWDGYIPQETLELYRIAGFAKPAPLGKNPALLVIDVQYSTTGEKPMPFPDALNYHPMNCGEAAWKAIDHIKALLSAFRKEGFPVIYPHVWGQRYQGSPSRMPNKYVNPRHLEIVAEIAPIEGEILLPKTTPSAFFGTPLSRYLQMLKTDTLFLVGNTTSGCIRATVIDACAHAFQVVVAHEGCYDRSPVSHAVNLFDMASKYAEVVSTEQAVAMLTAFKRNQAAEAAA